MRAIASTSGGGAPSVSLKIPAMPHMTSSVGGGFSRRWNEPCPPRRLVEERNERDRRLVVSRWSCPRATTPRRDRASSGRAFRVSLLRGQEQWSRASTFSLVCETMFERFRRDLQRLFALD